MQNENKPGYTPKYDVRTELKGIDIVRKQYKNSPAPSGRTNVPPAGRIVTAGRTRTDSFVGNSRQATQPAVKAETSSRTIGSAPRTAAKTPGAAQTIGKAPQPISKTTESANALRPTPQPTVRKSRPVRQAPMPQSAKPNPTQKPTQPVQAGYNSVRRSSHGGNMYDRLAPSQTAAARSDKYPSAVGTPHRERPTDVSAKLNQRHAAADAKRRAQMEYDSIFGMSETQNDRHGSAGGHTILKRSLLVIGTCIVLVLLSAYVLLFTIANGPSTSLRDLLVQSALQSSAMKWVPRLFLPGATVDQIEKDSHGSTIQVIDPPVITPPKTGEEPIDEWAGAQDGMQFITFSGSTFKGYMLIVKDPSRVMTTTSCNFASEPSPYGITIFKMAEKHGAVAAINGGEYFDDGGTGTGDTPIGLIFSGGECMWSDAYTDRTFIGITKDNKLICREGMTKAQATSLGIRDGVSFQWGNVLIDTVDGQTRAHRADKNTGTAQRTAIGQRADGAIILLVTDGRTASSIGATRNDIIDVMIEYGAVSAGMLDGGSSALMYYENYYDKYGYDKAKLDKYQLQGLVNNYKAFTTPRRMPSFFAVMPE